jgi:hypothetical protein
MIDRSQDGVQYSCPSSADYHLLLSGTRPRPVRLLLVQPKDTRVFGLHLQFSDQGDRPPDHIELVFDKPVKADTLRGAIRVTASRNDGPDELVRPKQVRYDAASRTATFIPKKPFAEIARGSTTTFYLRVTGNGNKRLVDVDGLAWMETRMELLAATIPASSESNGSSF